VHDRRWLSSGALKPEIMQKTREEFIPLGLGGGRGLKGVNVRKKKGVHCAKLLKINFRGKKGMIYKKIEKSL